MVYLDKVLLCAQVELIDVITIVNVPVHVNYSMSQMLWTLLLLTVQGHYITAMYKIIQYNIETCLVSLAAIIHFCHNFDEVTFCYNVSIITSS